MLPRNRTHDENIARYLEDCQAGRYDRYQDVSGLTHFIECRIFWRGIRYHAARVTRDYIRATARLSEPNTRLSEPNTKSIFDDDTQSRDRGENVLMEELDTEKHNLLKNLAIV